MTFYYFMMERYQQGYQQLKCFAVFLSIFTPAFLILMQVRSYSNNLFHFLLFSLGWLTWTFAEYILHRFWMHGKGKGTSSITRSHQHHHSNPTKIMITGRQRLLMVMVVVVMCVTATWLDNYFTFLAGIVTGTVCYFHMHKLLHLRIAQKLFGRLCRYHIYHHCKYPGTCFGICVSWWDDLFQTVPQKPEIPGRILDFYFNGNPNQKQL